MQPTSSPDVLSTSHAIVELAVAADRDGVVARIVRRLIPFLCLLFIVNYLDRTNVGMAKLRMLGDTGITEKQYGLAAAIFFLGYFIFEVPSNLIMERVGARIWMTRIMVTWGLISAGMMFVHTATSFYWLRFLLGVAEAGFFPGIVLYLTYWIPSKQRSAVMAAFLTSTAVSGIVGNPLAGVLMKMDGIANLRGWQWLFLLEGIAPVLLGVATLMFLPDRPAKARWLSSEDRDWLANELARETQAGEHHVQQLAHAIRDVRLWMLSANYFMLIMGLYGFIYWLPSIIKSVTTASDLEDRLPVRDSVHRGGRDDGDHRAARRPPQRATLACRDDGADRGGWCDDCFAMPHHGDGDAGVVSGGDRNLGIAWAVLGAGHALPARHGGGGGDRDRQLRRRAGGIRCTLCDWLG